MPDPIPLPDYSFAQVCWDYLEKIRSLCEDNGIQLILVKAPTLYPAWYPQWEEQIDTGWWLGRLGKLEAASPSAFISHLKGNREQL